MSLTKSSVLNTLKKYWVALEIIINDKIDEAKRNVALGEIGTVIGSTADNNGKVGLVPQPHAGDETEKYLKADGTWAVPPDTTYNTGTNSVSGLTKLYNELGTNTDGTLTQQAIKNTIEAERTTTETKIQQSVSNLVNSAPETLDTLNELATALGNDPNFATTVTNTLANKLNKTDTAKNSEKVNNLTVETAVPANAKFTDTTYSAATTSVGGLMTAADKARLNKIGAYHYGSTSSPTKIKIKINSKSYWMLGFTINVMQSYRYYKILVSGYNYSNTKKWDSPQASLLGTNVVMTPPLVYFGYDGDNDLWVGLDGGGYSGIYITDVTNGYIQINNFADLFTITYESSLSGTLQTTVTALPSMTINNTSSATALWNSSGASHADNLRLVNANTLAYWNGAYNGTSGTSNLAYCNKGAFGTIVTKNIADYVAVTGGTMTGDLLFQSPKGRTCGFMLTNKDSTSSAYKTNLDIGWNYTNRDGAGFYIRSVDFGGITAGGFGAYARDASNHYDFYGLTSGLLQWAGPEFNIGGTKTNFKYNTSTGCLEITVT
jgi:hypothetical protein